MTGGHVERGECVCALETPHLMEEYDIGLFVKEETYP